MPLQRTRSRALLGRSPLNGGSLGGFRHIGIGIALLLGLMASAAAADWMPPSNPNPDKILSEAKADTASGRYSDALAKHLWFHQNALKYAPAMYGVRLSFALSAWGRLARLYPPALEQLKAVRDQAAGVVRDGGESRHAFHDFASINRELNEEAQTKDLFLWLDANNSAVAGQVYDIAQPALVEQGQYLLCGRYIEPQTSFDRFLQSYRIDKEMARNPDLKDMEAFAEKSFEYQTATLVALLVLNDRKSDAARIADQARSASDSSSLARQLEAALRGTCPKRWP